MLEWDTVVDEIKSKRNGTYPPDWAEKVIFGDVQSPDVDMGFNITTY